MSASLMLSFAPITQKTTKTETADACRKVRRVVLLLMLSPVLFSKGGRQPSYRRSNFWKPVRKAQSRVGSMGGPMSHSHCLFLLTLIAGFAIPLAAAADARHTSSGAYLFVANQGDRTMSIFDPGAGEQIVAVPEGGVTGHEVIASPDG